MTDDERLKLDEMYASVADIKAALFDSPPGAPPGTLGLIGRLYKLEEVLGPIAKDVESSIVARRRVTWILRGLIWVVPTIVAVATAFGTIRGWVSGILPK